MSLPFRLPRPALNTSETRSARLHPYLDLASRYWLFVTAAGIIGALLALGISQAVTPVYSARSTLYFSIGYGDTGSDLNQGASYAQGQMLSFAELARSERVLQPVASELELTTQELADQLEVSTPTGTVVLNIAASSTDPELAATMSNEVAQSLTSAVLDVAPRDADGKVTVSVRTVESASPPTVPATPNTRVNIVLGALIGLALSLLAIFAIRLLDTRVRDANGVAAAGGLPVLARLRGSSANAYAADPDSGVAEDYRRLTATLDAVGVPESSADSADEAPRGTSNRRARVFVLASVTADPDTDRADRATEVRAREDRGELDDATPATSPNKPSAAAIAATNLALAAADAGHRVALVSDSAPSSAVRSDSKITTRALSSRGTLPATLLGSHDLVLIAAPGSADGSRALRLAQTADGIVLLADEGQAHIGELRSAIEILRTAGARVVGTVLTTKPNTERRAARSLLPRTSSRRELPAVLEQNEA